MRRARLWNLFTLQGKTRLVTVGLVSLIAWLRAAPSPDRIPAADAIGYAPDDGTTVAVNPPWFAWVPVAGACAYDLELMPAGRATSRQHWEKLPYALFTPEKALAPGTYAWRFRARFDEAGTSLTAWSRARHFVVTTTAPLVPKPALEDVLERLPRTHPRLFVTSRTLATLRMTRTTHADWYRAFLREADSLLTAPLMREPRPWTGGRWNAAEWLEYYREIVKAAHCTETLAFAYLLSGDSRYAQAAKRWLMELASWDPSGTTSLRVNDEQAMHIMFSTARAYTWLHDRLTTDEQLRVRAMLAQRARDAYRHLHGSARPFEQFPYDSHSGRLWHFLGEVAMVLYGEVPEARQWLEYALTIYYGWYPIWGGSDGGWAEGLHYFLSYHEYLLSWLWQLENVLAIPATLKPFYALAGNFLIYTAPPGAVISGFGDFSENLPSARRAWVAAALALFRRDPLLEWYAQRLSLPTQELSPLRFLLATARRPAPRPPSVSTVFYVFPATGLVTYHSALDQPDRDIAFLARVSPLGNLSHSHCDQLAFVMSAFGDPLFVNTGFRDYYGSPFCYEWYWHTRSHNAVLVDGEGQMRGMAAKAKLLASGQSPELVWFAGDATPAYGGRANLVRRTVAIVPRAEAHVIAILDDIDTTRSTIQVLFHSRVRPSLSPEAETFDLETTHARVRARCFSAIPLQLAATDRYSTTPALSSQVAATRLPEWHLTVSASCPSGTTVTRFQVLSVLEVIPRRGTPRWASHMRVARWGDVTTLRWSDRRKGEFRACELTFNISHPEVRFRSSSSPWPDSSGEPPLEARLPEPLSDAHAMTNDRESSPAHE